jgi:formylglycine-generating enzyme required for sulfatase activity
MLTAVAARRLALAVLGAAALLPPLLGAAAPRAATSSPQQGARGAREVEVGRALQPLGVARLENPGSPMVRIGASSFQMGSDDADVANELGDCAREAYGHRCSPAFFSNETPRHPVSLSSYWIDRFEVSVADYERCVVVGRCEPRPTSEATRRFDRPDFPVTRVTWNDAAAYCAFRGARLPTEAEFERAARGKTGRRYPWGNLFNTRAVNHGRFGWDVTEDADGFVELAPIGSFPDGVTPEGIHDLAGNVAEWVLDRYAPSYEAVARTDPRGPGVGGSNLRVVRGGSYAQPRFRVRGAARAFAEPGERRSTLGFRCAKGETPRPAAE